MKLKQQADLFDIMCVEVEERQATEVAIKYKIEAVPDYAGADFLRVRKKYGLSQQRFALLLGVKRNTLSGYENEAKPPSMISKRMLGLLEKHPELFWKYYECKLVLL
ncbi:helix-turn-helix domain-containing protein [Listeria monocytogenes]|nr:helix-turn-helix domain-containing protein [Listeria monocytogenes]